MSKPRRHHYVPHCYLKLFSVSHKKVPQICVYDRVERTAFKTGIDNIAAQRDFNRFETEDHGPYALERGMASFEDELSQALLRLTAKRSLADDNDRAYLLNFIGLMAIRTPRFRELTGKLLTDTAKMTMEAVLQSQQSYEQHTRKARDAGSVLPEVTYDDMKRMFENGGFIVEPNREHQIQQELLLFDKVLPLLFKRGWHLLKAPSASAGFITSDHPFALFWSDPKMRDGFYGPGLSVAGTEIVFPVSPRLAVIGAFEIKDGERDVSNEVVASINGATVAMAQRQVYARDQNFTYLMQYHESERKGAKLHLDRDFTRPAKTERTSS